MIIAMGVLVASSVTVVIYYSRAPADQDTSYILTMLRGKHSAEEDSLLMQGSVDWHFSEPAARSRLTEAPDSMLVDFVFVFSRTHCGNCVRDEVSRLNLIRADRFSNVRSVVGYSLDSPNDSLAQAFNSSYAGVAFPVHFKPSVANHFGTSLGSTPVLFIVDALTHAILDVHRPIPTDVDNVEAFFERWYRILQL